MDDTRSPFQSCGIYTRQSRPSDGDFSSCEAQFEACCQYVVSQFSQRWLLNGRSYNDDGEASESLDRPAIQRLVADIEQGKVQRVVVHRFDRLSRSMRHFAELLERFRSNGIALTIVTSPELGSSAADMLVLNVLGAFAEFEREMIHDRMAESRAVLKARGRRVAGVVPYGYISDEQTRQLEIEPTESQRVRAMFRLATEGKTPTEIARLANERGWRTKRRRGTEGGPWTPRQVLATLSNPTYSGLIRDGDSTRPGMHEAIVDQDVFDAVRRQVESRRTRSSGRRDDEVWALRGLLHCGQCGRPMSPNTSGYRNFMYCYYRCRSTAGGTPPCKGVRVPAWEIEQFVVQTLNGLDYAAVGRKIEANKFDQFKTWWTAAQTTCHLVGRECHPSRHE